MCIGHAPLSALLRVLACAFGLLAAAFSPSTLAIEAAPNGADAIEVGAIYAVPSPLLAIDRNRGTVVDRIVADWGDALVRANAGLSRDQLRTMLAALRADQLLAASLAGSLEGLRDVMATALSSGEREVKYSLLQAKNLGDPTADLVYTPVLPCRLFDSRASQSGQGPLAPGVTRTYSATAPLPQQGGPGGCVAPAGAAAAMIQIVPLSPTGPGLLQGGASGTGPFANALVLYQPGEVNGASIPMPVLVANGRFDLVAQFNAVEVAGDLLGYFRAPQGGFVSSVTAGTGLTGGTITSTGTIAIADGGVGATQLAAKSVTQAKLSPVATPTAGQVLGSDGTNLQWQTVGGGGGGVSAVTASAPLASSGGSTPNISLTGTVPVANGGTGRTTLANNGVIIGQGAGAVATTAAGTAGQVLVGTAGAPAWSSSPTFAGNLYVMGGALLNPNVGIGSNDPQAIVHIQQASSTIPPRVESLGATSFGAGWDFYLNGNAKGYVGVPDAGAPFGAGELMLYGGLGTRTSLWGGQTRALTIAGTNSGNIGIGTTPASNVKVLVNGGTNFGVYSQSTNTGVYGESNTASLSEAGVRGVNTASGGIGVTGEANAGTATGVFGTSASATGFGVYARNTAGGKALAVEGNAIQGLTSGGLAKALIFVDEFGAIVRCYNGVTGSSTAPCGFSVAHPVVGNYTVNFGFQVDNRYTVFQIVRPLGWNPLSLYINDFPNANAITIGAIYFDDVGGKHWVPWNVGFYAMVF